MLLIVSLVSATSDKVEVCHKGNTISISENAVKAHIAHGDYIGECTGNPGNNSDSSMCEYNYTIPDFVYQDEEVCDSISGLWNRYSKDLCYYEVGVNMLYPDICEKIKGDYKRDSCYGRIAEQTNDLCLCDNMKSFNNKDRCYYWIATINKKADICENVLQNSLKDSCFIKIGIATNDIAVCKRITIYSGHDSCAVGIANNLKDESICSIVKTQIWKDACIGVGEI